MFCPYFIVGVDLGVRAAYQLRLARPIVWGCTCALFLLSLPLLKKSPTNKNAISRSCGDGARGQRSVYTTY